MLNIRDRPRSGRVVAVIPSCGIKSPNFVAQASLHIQKVTNNRAIDIQALRHFHLFLPLGYVPSSPVFKQHLSIAYIEDAKAEEQTDASESEDQALTTKGGKNGTTQFPEDAKLLGPSELQKAF